jgi:amino acid permease
MSDDDDSGMRAGSVNRRHSSIRDSVMTAVSAVEEQIDVGTIGGTVLNTTCNVIGAGVLSLPLAAYNASLGWSIILIVVMALLGAFSAFVLFHGCDRTGAYFMNEVLAVAVIGKPRRRPKHSDEVHSMPELGSATAPTDPLPSATGPAPGTIAKAQHGSDATLTEEEALEEDKRDKMRTVISVMVDVIIIVNNYVMLAVYTRIIIDAIPPVLIDFLGADKDSIWANQGFWVIVSAVIFFGLTSVRNMAELKWSSILGVVTILFAALAVVIEYCRNGYQKDDTAEYREFGIYSQFASAVATLSTAFGYHYNAPLFYHELQDRSPKKMMKTVAISFPIIGVTYILVAIFGYLSFGTHVNDSDAGGDIINNYPTDNALINVVRLGLFFHFAAVFPVLSVCVRHCFHRLVLTISGRRDEAIHPDMPARVRRIVIVGEAFLIVATAATFAYYYSNVGMLIIYVGAVSGATVMFTIPGIVGMCVWAKPLVRRASESPLVALAGAGTYGATHDDNEDDEMLGSATNDPMPHAQHRKLLFGMSVVLVVFGYVATVASFASAVLSS